MHTATYRPRPSFTQRGSTQDLNISAQRIAQRHPAELEIDCVHWLRDYCGPLDIDVPHWQDVEIRSQTTNRRERHV